MPGVSTTHPLYDGLTDKWERCRDAAAGTDAVKAKGAKYLPMLASHKEESTISGQSEKYNEYKLRALYYNATDRTIQGLSGAIFQKAPSIDIQGPKEVEEQVKDITLTGEPLDIFALKSTKEYLTTGRYGILVDMANVEATKPRPYWVGYAAEDIINWKFEARGGDQKLVLVVLREVIEKDEEDEFKPKLLTQYRVLRLKGNVYSQQLYVEEQAANTTKKEYLPETPVIPLRNGRALDFIPFALPWAIVNPPLLDLVDVNLAHYRSSADLKQGLHYTALPTPWVSGAFQNTPGPGNQPVVLNIGSGKAWQLEKDGKAGMLEFTGAGLGAIRTDIQDMQRMMATLGARLLEEAPHYAETALSVAMRHGSDYATLRTIAQVVEQQISYALKIHCWWLGNEKSPEQQESHVELNKVFFDQAITADELRALLMALQARSISFKTFYMRLQNTGWTREGVDHEEELKDIQTDPIEDVLVTKQVADSGPPDVGQKKKKGQRPEPSGEPKA